MQQTDSLVNGQELKAAHEAELTETTDDVETMLAETEAEHEAAMKAAIEGLRAQMTAVQALLTHQQQASEQFKAEVEPQLEIAEVPLAADCHAVILLHPRLHLVGVSVVMERERASAE